MKKIFLVIALFFALSPFVVSYSSAGGYGHGYGYQNYGYGYNYGYQHNYITEVSPVVVIGVPVSNLGVGYYWSVGDELREERVAQKAAALVNKSNPGKTQIQRQPATAIAPGPGILLDFDLVGSEIAQQTSVPEQSVSNQPTGLDIEVTKIFSQSCIRCHKPGTNKPGGLTLLNADGSLFKTSAWRAELNRRTTIYDSVRGTQGISAMPKNADQLSDELIEVLYLWLREHSNGR